MRKAIPVVAFILVLLVVQAPVAAPAKETLWWPTWRGPQMNGISTATDLPVKWSPEENVAWKLALTDRSGSTPIIWKDRIFLTTVSDDTIELWAVDRKKGSLEWKQPLGIGGKARYRKHNMSSPSPVTDGKWVYVMTGTGLLRAFDFKGKEQWLRDIQKDYGNFGLNWGFSSSPLLHEGALYVQVLHGMKTDDPSYVLRINAKDGKTMWRVERPNTAIRESPDSYTTPALLQDGKKLTIVITGADCVTGHDADTGKELWRVNGLNPDNNPAYRIVASPTVFDGVIYAPTRVRPLTAFRAPKFGETGDITESHKLWTSPNGPDVPTPVTDGKYFYVVNDRGIMWCLDAKTGAVVWGDKRIRPGIYSASPVLADGKIYVTSEEGVTSVVKAGAEFELLAENPLAEYTLSSPAIVEGQIFLRTEKALYAIGKK
jgi:outer membrane protein assembly factor BamB